MIREERNALLLLVAFTIAATLLYVTVLRPALDHVTRPSPVRHPSAESDPAPRVDTRPKSARRMLGLEARLVDAVTGTPLPDADVTVTNVDDIAEPTATLDEDGHLRIDHLPPEITFGVGIECDGYEPRQFSHLRGDARSIIPLGVVALEPRRQVQVVVRDAEGGPVDRARVTLHPRDARATTATALERAARVAEAVLATPLQTSATDADGAATMRDIPAAAAVVVVSNGEDGATAHEVDPFSGSVREEVVLAPGVTFRGEIVDPSGNAVARARVVLVESKDGPGPGLSFAVVDTDADGRFTATRVDPVPHYVFVIAPGRAARGLGPYPSDTEHGVLITAPDGADVEGKVLTRTGVPPADAEVTGRANVPGAVLRRAKCDRAGSFVLEGLSVGHAVVELNARGYAPERAHVPVASFGGEVSLRLDAPGRLIGTVTADGEPVSGAVVRDLRDGARAVSDVRGEFRLDGLAAGRVDLEARAARHAPARVEAEVRLREEAGIRIALTPGGELEVLVQGPGSEARPFATVSAYLVLADGSIALLPTTSAITGSTGRARLVNLGAERPVVLFVRASGHAPARSNPIQVTPELASAGVALTLGAGGLVEGTVTDAAGALVTGAAIIAIASPDHDDDRGRIGFASWTTRTADDGTFRLSNIPSGHHVLVARRGGDRAMSAPLAVRDGARIGGVVLALAPVSPLRGRVIDASGRPIADAVVTFREAPTADAAASEAAEPILPSPVRATVRTDAAGRFEVAPDRSVPYSVEVIAGDRRVTAEVEPSASEVVLRFEED